MFEQRYALGNVTTFVLIAMVTLMYDPSSILASPDANARHHEFWDATTLDVDNQLRSLDGVWEHVPWQRLDEPPSFEDASPVKVPAPGRDGAFRTTFSVASKPGAKRVILHFSAVGYHCRVFVNGQPVGSHLGGYTPFEFDVSEHVREGDNELVVLLLGVIGTLLNPEEGDAVGTEQGFTEASLPIARAANRAIIGYGYFRREGIRHSVHVREVPLLRVADVTMTSSFRDMQIQADVRLQNQTGAARPVNIRMDVLPYEIATGQIGTDPVLRVERQVELSAGPGQVELKQAWPDATLWMPGDPHLYVARVQLVDASTQAILDQRHIRFGFREVWIDGRNIMINGVAMRAFTHGTLDTEAGVDALRAMFKQLNDVGINTVRPTTMPPPTRFALLADEMGMMLIGESELTFNRNYAYDQPSFWTHFQRTWSERVARDKNHPSIVIWSLANEAIITAPNQPIGEKFYESFRHLQQVDPTRPIMQEGDGDLRDYKPDSHGFPIDIINIHFYYVSPTKNPLWATEFPPVAWAMEDISRPEEIPGAFKYGAELPDRDRPWFAGEFGPATAIAYPDHFAFWTGPAAYRDLFGQAEPLVRGIGETMKLQIQGFRDMGLAGMDPWDVTRNEHLAPYMRSAMEPVTVFTRDRLRHWRGGTTAQRPLVVLNDSFEPHDVTLVTTLTQDGRVIDRQSEKLTIPAGERHDVDWSFQLPDVQQTTGCQFHVELNDAQGQLVSGFTQDWEVFPEQPASSGWHADRVRLIGDTNQLGQIAEWSGLTVHGPDVVRQLDAERVRFVLVDQSVFNALGSETGPLLERYIDRGGVVMTLNVGSGSAAGVNLQATRESDATRLFTQRSHPLTDNIPEKQWQFWQPDHYVSRANYAAPFDPAFEIPLIASGIGGLRYTPLIIARYGRGALVACALQLNEAVATEPVARQLLNNLAAYADTLREADDNDVDRKLMLLARPEELADWEARMREARVLFGGMADEQPLRPGVHHVLLTGNASPSARQLQALEQFVRGGGTLWVHRLTPQTPYLATLTDWLGQPISLRPPQMWLQQFEIEPKQFDHPLLDGISDYHTCWATFGWTNGNDFSVRTTAIADYVLEPDGHNGEALLYEPDWLGKWDVTSSAQGTLSQKILRSLETHPRNESPGIGMTMHKLGQGTILIDQLRWDATMQNRSSESHEKARYFFGTLWKNMSRHE
ncbi:glycoside hydrolase family 2 protein [Phycisphaerales bacterium AB-hyl4]|uniref:Glycoside hydrolase family 2 protein n=1 Tax=Natronomicrosphaera hydrolytica TaxID=3242702 RepID=A0ABV4U7N3_9BACT